MKIIIMLFIIFISFTCIAYSEDNYSNDFDYNSSAQYHNDSRFNSFTGDDSPSARYNNARDQMEYRKTLKKIQNREKYTYKPYSPNVYQKRKTYDPKNVDWDKTWYEK